MIDIEKTISLRGYDPLMLSRGSGRRVWAVCNKCGFGRWVSIGGYRDLCRRCAGINAIKALTKRNKGRSLSIIHRKKISKSMEGKNSGDKNGSWRGGVSFVPYCYKFNFEFKETVRYFFNRLCFLCGVTEEESGMRHDVHHVNYNKNCLCDSNCEFVPLCRSCHNKTNHNRRY